MPEEATPRYACVALNVPLDRVFHYRVPPPIREALAPGARVRVPFGRREMIGYCVGFTDAPDVEESRLRDLAGVVDRAPLLDERLLALTRWMAQYYCCGWGEALEAVLPGAVRKRRAVATVLMVAPARSAEELRARADAVAARAPRQARALRALALARGEMAARDLVAFAECDTPVLHALARAGFLALRRQTVEDDPTLQFEVQHSDPLPPTPDQAAALERVAQAAAEGRFKVFLVHGVTGSGKTELYLQALARVVAQGRQGIVLIPEIALTPQTVARFKARFDRVCVLHSVLSERGRRAQWQAIREGRADVVIGARSAVFAPLPRLGLLVVDEEHEPSFKQQNTPRYHARDAGIWRARQENALVLLGSATPSLESWQHARAGKYELLRLPARIAGRPLPPVEIVPLSSEPFRKGAPPLITRRLQNAVESALKDGRQAILFLNRRGFHTHIQCPRCGYALKCARCDVSLIHHRATGRAVCHYCGHDIAAPETCPGCNAPNIKYGGAGTQRVEERIAEAFGAERVARMDSDAMRTWGSYEKTLGDFRDGKTRILLGTQMIAKGLDFPNVTVVGIINADISLNLPDFRASERTFQLLLQVAGRTGRGEAGGRVYLQTYAPEHPCIRFAARHDYAGFAAWELQERQAHGYPPFTRLARVLVEGRSRPAVAARADAAAESVRRAAPPDARLVVLGPEDAPIARIKDLHRRHFLVKSPSASALHAVLAAVDRRRTGGVQVIVDVDPAALL